MDADTEYTKLILESDATSIVVGVLGKGAEYVFIPLDEAEAHAKRIELSVARGMCFCGLMAFSPRTKESAAKCEPDPECVKTMMHAAYAFDEFVRNRLRERVTTKDESVEFLERLWLLPDTRTDECGSA
jgi:hypothetical protein